MLIIGAAAPVSPKRPSTPRPNTLRVLLAELPPNKPPNWLPRPARRAIRLYQLAVSLRHSNNFALVLPKARAQQGMICTLPESNTCPGGEIGRRRIKIPAARRVGSRSDLGHQQSSAVRDVLNPLSSATRVLIPPNAKHAPPAPRMTAGVINHCKTPGHIITPPSSTDHHRRQDAGAHPPPPSGQAEWHRRRRSGTLGFARVLDVDERRAVIRGKGNAGDFAAARASQKRRNSPRSGITASIWLLPMPAQSCVGRAGGNVVCTHSNHCWNSGHPGCQRSPCTLAFCRPYRSGCRPVNRSDKIPWCRVVIALQTSE